jgi:hypothetical protein
MGQDVVGREKAAQNCNQIVETASRLSREEDADSVALMQSGQAQPVPSVWFLMEFRGRDLSEFSHLAGLGFARER